VIYTCFAVLSQRTVRCMCQLGRRRSTVPIEVSARLNFTDCAHFKQHSSPSVHGQAHRQPSTMIQLHHACKTLHGARQCPEVQSRAHAGPLVHHARPITQQSVRYCRDSHFHIRFVWPCSVSWSLAAPQPPLPADFVDDPASVKDCGTASRYDVSAEACFTRMPGLQQALQG